MSGDESRVAKVLLISGLAMVLMVIAQAAFLPPCHRDCESQQGYADWQRSNDAATSMRILQQWTEASDLPSAADGKVPRLEVVEGLRYGLYWDFGLLLSYAVFGWMAARHMFGKLGIAEPWARAAASIWPMAALFDALENLASLRMLARWPLEDGSVAIVSALATTKWLLLIVAAAMTILSLLILARLPQLPNRLRLLGDHIHAKAQSWADNLDAPAVSGWRLILAWVWSGARHAGFLLMLVRVPLLLVLTGVLLTRYLPQINELLLLSLSNGRHALLAYLASGLLGLLIWASARTLYSFDWSRHANHLANWHQLDVWFPRLLAALVPVTMMFGYLSLVPIDRKPAFFWSALYLSQAVLLLVLTVKRRDWQNELYQRFSTEVPQATTCPVTGNRTAWQARPGEGSADVQVLPRGLRRFHYLGLAVFVAAMLMGAEIDQLLGGIGPLGLILLGACWVVWASTAPVYWASRIRLPLISLLLAWATAMHYLGFNDNHIVRLEQGQSSASLPSGKLEYGIGQREAAEVFVDKWLKQHADCEVINLVSAEGGGIRAALWTVLVLNEIQSVSLKRKDAQPGTDFWSCTLAASGVSGGSLGLAVFAAWQRDLGTDQAQLRSDELANMLQTDFLAPILLSTFGQDQLQRLLPLRWFDDRGQALEDAWINAYRKALNKDSASAVGDSFSAPLADLTKKEERRLPALLFNATVVATGQRLVQHPFAPQSPGEPFRCCATVTPSEHFPAAIDGADWMPAQLPVSSAVLNSARFTYVSPAGTVYRSCQTDAGCTAVSPIGQVVDGGYFEVSGAVTLSDMIRLIRESELERPLRAILISNDPSVEAIMEDRRDECPDERRKDKTRLVHAGPTVRGEVVSPLLSLYQAREARGQQARRDLRRTIQRDAKRISEAGLDSWLFLHARLCPARRPFPLGWTVGRHTHEAMQKQISRIRQLLESGVGLTQTSAGTAPASSASSAEP